jgi:hypothetical protein
MTSTILYAQLCVSGNRIATQLCLSVVGVGVGVFSRTYSAVSWNIRWLVAVNRLIMGTNVDKVFLLELSHIMTSGRLAHFVRYWFVPPV